MTRALSPRSAVVVAALVSAACGPPLLKLPTAAGTSVPSADAAQAYAGATAACSRVRTLTSELSLSGSAAGRRLRGRLLVGLAAPASIRIELITSFGPPLFVLVAKESDATLLLPQDNRVVKGEQPAAVLDALAGIPLAAADLVTTLTGCGPAPTALSARKIGDAWQVLSTDSDERYLRLASGNAWQLVAIEHRSSDNRWRAEFSDRQADGVPRGVRITSLAASATAFDLRLGLSQVEANPTLGADVFTVRVAASAESMTLDELRRAGPLGAAKSGGR